MIALESIAGQIEKGITAAANIEMVGGVKLKSVLQRDRDAVSFDLDATVGGRKHFHARMRFDWCGERVIDRSGHQMDHSLARDYVLIKNQHDVRIDWNVDRTVRWDGGNEYRRAGIWLIGGILSRKDAVGDERGRGERLLGARGNGPRWLSIGSADDREPHRIVHASFESIVEDAVVIVFRPGKMDRISMQAPSRCVIGMVLGHDVAGQDQLCILWYVTVVDLQFQLGQKVRVRARASGGVGVRHVALVIGAVEVFTVPEHRKEDDCL